MSYVVTGLALCTTGGLFVLLTNAPTGRLLGALLLVDGFHLVAHGAPAITQDPQVGQAILNTFHVPLFFLFLVQALFVSSFTGLHQRFWSRPAVLAAALAIPAAMLAVELRHPSPFWVFSATGVHVVDGPLAGVAALYGLFLLAFEFYALGLVAVSVARETDPARVPGLSLLFLFLLVRDAPLVWEYASNGATWGRLALAGVPTPGLLPHLTWVEILVSVVFVVLPVLLVRRRAAPFLRSPLTLVGILAATLVAVVPLSVEASAPRAYQKSLFGALLLTYAVLRQDLFPTRRGVARGLEMPIAVLGFALLFFIFVGPLARHLPAWGAVTLGLGLALVSSALVLRLSRFGAPFRPPAPPVPGPRAGPLSTGPRAAGAPPVPPPASERAVSAQGAVGFHGGGEGGWRVDRGRVERGADAESLAQRLAVRGPLDLRELRAVGLGILAALEAAHARGVVHGNVSARHVRLSASGGVELTGFPPSGVADADATEDIPAGLAWTGPEPDAVGERAPTVARDLADAAATLREAWAWGAAAGSLPAPGPSGGESPLDRWFAAALASGRPRFATALAARAAFESAIAEEAAGRAPRLPGDSTGPRPGEDGQESQVS